MTVAAIFIRFCHLHRQQGFCLAATELGLGTCWVCNFDAAKCRELFAMTDKEEPAVIIPIGYPDCEVTPKKRKEMAEIIIEEQD